VTGTAEGPQVAPGVAAAVDLRGDVVDLGAGLTAWTQRCPSRAMIAALMALHHLEDPFR